MYDYNYLGVNVIVINQVPQQEINPRFYYYLINSNKNKFLNKIENLSVSVEEHKKYQRYINNLFNIFKGDYANFHLIDLTDIFCKKNCIFGNVKKSYYLDENHLSEDGVKFLEKKITNSFDKIIFD